MTGKIIDLAKLQPVLLKKKKEGKKIVQCHGVFDLIHPGHIKHFEAAKKFGDILVVSITEDKHVNKGPDRPIFNEKLRAESIAVLEFVDFVTINNSATAVTAIEVIQPDFYVKGQDYKNADDDFSGGIVKEKETVEKFGGKLVFTNEIQFSSSKLINQFLDEKDESVVNYLKKIRHTLDFDSVKKIFDDISNLKVLVIGDVILDEYQFVWPLGKASKSATITSKLLGTELYAGGVLAVANHIADFVKEVTLITGTGLNNGHDYLDFIKSHLHKSVKLDHVFTPGRPTVLKRRFVDSVFKQKLFEVTEIDDSPLDSKIRTQISKKISKAEKLYDLIVIADFGHGLLDNVIVNQISGMNIFMALNTQTNSANQGYNMLTKYPACDYFSIDQQEARLAMHDRDSDIKLIQKQLLEKTNATLGAITLGVKGAIVTERKSGNSTHAPVLSREVIDTIGAGDAFLSITSLLAKQNVSVEHIAFIGNAVGAMAVKILGNKSYIEKTPLLKYLKTLLS